MEHAPPRVRLQRSKTSPVAVSTTAPLHSHPVRKSPRVPGPRSTRLAVPNARRQHGVPVDGRRSPDVNSAPPLAAATRRTPTTSSGLLAAAMRTNRPGPVGRRRCAADRGAVLSVFRRVLPGAAQKVIGTALRDRSDASLCPPPHENFHSSSDPAASECLLQATSGAARADSTTTGDRVLDRPSFSPSVALRMVDEILQERRMFHVVGEHPVIHIGDASVDEQHGDGRMLEIVSIP